MYRLEIKCIIIKINIIIIYEHAIAILITKKYGKNISIWSKVETFTFHPNCIHIFQLILEDVLKIIKQSMFICKVNLINTEKVN